MPYDVGQHMDELCRSCLQGSSGTGMRVAVEEHMKCLMMNWTQNPVQLLSAAGEFPAISALVCNIFTHGISVI